MSTRVAVCDYGVGNLRSVERALLEGGAVVEVTHDPRTIDACDGLVLPGVGAFGAAREALAERGLDAAVRGVAARGAPLLGVCLGFQLLFEWSAEGGGGAGLALLPGRVERLGPERGKVPHMGWNGLHIRRASALLDGVPEGACVYFVHSYAPLPAQQRDVVAVADYGGEVVAACERGSVLGTQFHPEKSGRDGLRIYANFVRLCRSASRLETPGPVPAT